MSIDQHEAEPLRILTIDNGGLQALSVLRTLKVVCQSVTATKTEKDWKAPHELFDIIAGIGTGGWLALLLGRYKLDIDECMSVYINIANAANPKRRPSGATKQSVNPTAISSQALVNEIDRIIAEDELGEYLVEKEEIATPSSKIRKCHAFAVGVRKRQAGETSSEYDLFRAYHPPAGVDHDDPDPTKCRVSAVCAATASAKSFMEEHKVGQTVYWDEDFPNTHNISELALDEAYRIFGTRRSLSALLNISPGVPNARQLETLQRRANKNATRSFRIINRFRKAMTLITLQELNKIEYDSKPSEQIASASPHERRHDSPQSESLSTIRRSSTSDSASSLSKRAREEESKHQKAIKDRLYREFGHADIYYRLAHDAQESETGELKPYLDDIDRPDVVGKFMDNFLSRSASKKTIANIVEGWTRGHRHIGGQQQAITPNTAFTESPAQSQTSIKYHLPSEMATASDTVAGDDRSCRDLIPDELETIPESRKLVLSS